MTDVDGNEIAEVVEGVHGPWTIWTGTEFKTVGTDGNPPGGESYFTTTNCSGDPHYLGGLAPVPVAPGVTNFAKTPEGTRPIVSFVAVTDSIRSMYVGSANGCQTTAFGPTGLYKLTTGPVVVPYKAPLMMQKRP